MQIVHYGVTVQPRLPMHGAPLGPPPLTPTHFPLVPAAHSCLQNRHGSLSALVGASGSLLSPVEAAWVPPGSHASSAAPVEAVWLALAPEEADGLLHTISRAGLLVKSCNWWTETVRKLWTDMNAKKQVYKICAI